MNNGLSLKILECYVEIDKVNDDINNKIFNFITKANELVKISEDEKIFNTDYSKYFLTLLLYESIEDKDL